MYQLNKENRREEQELYRLRQELGFGGVVGHQSEPTTPPEIRDSGFPSALSKPNRFSASNLTSPTGMLGRKTPGDSSRLNSPPNERARAYNALTSAAPDTSTPQSRQESDGEEERDETFDVNHRSAAS